MVREQPGIHVPGTLGFRDLLRIKFAESGKDRIVIHPFNRAVLENTAWYDDQANPVRNENISGKRSLSMNSLL